MPEKKNQHLVPACYLRRFEADVSEMQKFNPNYSSGIYVNDNNLTSRWKLRSVTHKSLTRPYFYNLPEDNPKVPLIENFLSVIEGSYKKYSEEIINGIINNENMSFMSYFVTLQFMRVESFLESIQSSFDKAGESMDSFSGGNYHSSTMKDIAKKQLTEVDLGHILYPNAAIIYNNTNFPFVTSDNPVVRRQVNVVDARKIIPARYLHIEKNESREFSLFFMPLSPAVAYISCEMVIFKEKLIYFDDDLENIFYLNYYSIVNSYKKVYSSVIEPIKGEKQLSEYLSSKSGTIFKITHDRSHDSYYPSSKLSAVIGQVVRYIEEIERQRDSIIVSEGFDTLKIRAKIIVGRDGNIEQVKALRNLNSHLHRVEIITYDQLLKVSERILGMFDVVASLPQEESCEDIPF